MVDHIELNEAEVGDALLERKVWIRPRLETFDVADQTRGSLGNTSADGGGHGGLGTCLS
jgi:hypothetical protein